MLARDLATYAIVKEVEAGRGSPHGGAYLSFEHCSAAALREAFGPVIDRLADNGIDLTNMPVEVAPIAHYHMGGVAADADMAPNCPASMSPAKWSAAPMAPTGCPAMPSPKLLVFGRRAGKQRRRAMPAARRRRDLRAAGRARRARSDQARPATVASAANTAAMIARLQAIMADDVGPFRTGAKLRRALAGIAALGRELGERPPGRWRAFDLQRLEWFDLRNMICGCAARSRNPRSIAAKAAARISARIFPAMRRTGRCISACAGATARCKSPARRPRRWHEPRNDPSPR